MSSPKIHLLAVFSFTVFCLIAVTTSAAPPDCSLHVKTVSDAEFRRKYLFLQKTTTVSNQQRSPTGQNPKTLNKWCPWTWTVDKKVDRIPQYFLRAKCANCGFRCAPIMYNHRAMEWADHCDAKTGDKFLKWIYVPLEVAFVDTGKT